MNKKTVLGIVLTVVFLTAITIAAVRTSNQNKTITKEGYYFNTFISLTAYTSKDEKALNECMLLCQKYDEMFDRNKEQSDIYKINHSNGSDVEVNPETYELLKKALEFCEETDGAADITVAGLIDTWGLNIPSDAMLTGAEYDEERSKPEDFGIKEALSHVDYKNVILKENNTVCLSDPSSQIDLGFIAKGYIADRLKECLIENNVKSAIISLGGNICLVGSKPDGSDYNVGIKDPDNEGNIINELKLSDTNAVTSGTYERYVIYDGIKYHHILSTETGYPVDNNVKSVTILCDSSTDADALSTICLILGEEGSEDILKKYNAQAYFYYAE